MTGIGRVRSGACGQIDAVCPVDWSHPLTKGLVSWWLCVPGWMGGSRLVDIARPGPHGNHGTLTNGPTWAGSSRPGGFGSIGTVGDADAYVQNAASSGLPTGASSPWTFAFWHRTRTLKSLSCPFGFGEEARGAGGTVGAKRAVLQFGGAGDYYFWGENRDWDTGVAWDVDSTWHHVAFTYDAASGAFGDLRFYRDGRLAAGPNTLASTLTTAGSYLYACTKHPSGTSPDADFDDGIILARCWSAAEVAAWYDQSRRGHPDTLRRLRRTWFVPEEVAGGTTRGIPFGTRGTAFNGGRTLRGILR